MLDKLRNIGKQTALYGFGNILNKLLGFILIPMYQSHIPIGNFGNLIYFETIIVFLTAFLNYGIGPAHQRFFYIENENKTYGVYLFNNFFGCFILAVVSILPLLYFSVPIATSLCKDILQAGNFRIVMWIVVVEIMYGLCLLVLQYNRNHFNFYLIMLVKLLITFFLTAYLVIDYSMGIEGVLIARLAGGVLINLVAILWIILPRCTFSFNIRSITQSIIFGFPFVISTLGYTLFMLSDRFMLNWLSTSEQVGKYGFGFKIANFINLIFVQTIGMSYFPSVMSNESKADNIRYYRKMLTYYCFLLAILILGFLFFYQNILWIVGKNKEYWEGLKVVPILSLSFMVMGMNYFVGVGLFLKNQTKNYLVPSFSALIVNIILNLFLIPKYGMMGAAYSVVVAQIIYTGLLSFYSGKYMKIDFEWNKIFSIFILAILIYIIDENLPLHNFFFVIIVKLIFLIFFPWILFKFGFFEQIELQRAKEGIYKVWSKFKLG